MTDRHASSPGVSERRAIVLERPENIDKLILDGTEYSMIYLEALKVSKNPLPGQYRDLLQMRLDRTRFVVSGDIDVGDGSFCSFGDDPLFDECYIGHDRIFSQQGAGSK